MNDDIKESKDMAMDLKQGYMVVKLPRYVCQCLSRTKPQLHFTETSITIENNYLKGGKYEVDYASLFHSPKLSKYTLDLWKKAMKEEGDEKQIKAFEKATPKEKEKFVNKMIKGNFRWIIEDRYSGKHKKKKRGGKKK